MKGDDYYDIIHNIIMYLVRIGSVNFYRRVGIPDSIWRHNYIRTNSSMDNQENSKKEERVRSSRAYPFILRIVYTFYYEKYI